MIAVIPKLVYEKLIRKDEFDRIEVEYDSDCDVQMYFVITRLYGHEKRLTDWNLEKYAAKHICSQLDLPEHEVEIIISELEMLKATSTLMIRRRELENELHKNCDRIPE